MVGLGTICSVTINGIFLKAGIPVASRFGGVVETANGKPLRFVSLISYEGSSLILSKCSSEQDDRSLQGRGRGPRQDTRQLPGDPRGMSGQGEKLARTLEDRGIRGILLIGSPNKPLLEVPVGIDRAGIVIVGGLNPVAVLEEHGIATESKAMSTLFEYSHLVPFKGIMRSALSLAGTRALAA